MAFPDQCITCRSEGAHSTNEGDVANNAPSAYNKAIHDRLVLLAANTPTAGDSFSQKLENQEPTGVGS